MRCTGDYDDARHAERYDKRPATTRAELRILRRMLPGSAAGGTILDVPCGNGRLTPFLRTLGPARILGADTAFAMVRAARESLDHAAVADAFRLPYARASVDTVVCMRLLHHLPTPRLRQAVLAELARVSRRFVVVSYYSAASLEGLRRRFRPKRTSTRAGIHPRTFRSDLEAAGLELCRAQSLFPFLREQTLVLGRV